MKSPYEGLPDKSFWKTAVSSRTPDNIQDLWRPKFTLAASDRIATAGSCFAQHISRHLRDRNFSVVDAEPAPPGLSAEVARAFGYGIYSARYGNVYAVRQLLQLAQEAFGLFAPADAIWERDGRYFDALRPSVEPDGLANPDLVRSHRARHLERVRHVLTNADLFVFTLGLTESWIHKESGTVYPTAPGTIVGHFDPAVYAFKNFDFPEIYDDFLSFRRLIQEYNPRVKFLLTVSPVPLTATAAEHHVLVSTTYSKSVLRAVAGKLAEQIADIDYFPSYEIIATPFSRGRFYEDNLRSVTEAGVNAVMRVFFSDPSLAKPAPVNETTAAPAESMSPEQRLAMRMERRAARLAERGGTIENRKARIKRARPSAEDVVCEEQLLEAFSR